MPYNCEVCTLFNEINPGPHCQICGSPAPEWAIKDKKPKEGGQSMEAKPKPSAAESEAA